MVLVPFSQEHRVSVVASLTKNLNGNFNIEVDFTLTALWCRKRQKQDSTITVNCSDLKPSSVIKINCQNVFLYILIVITAEQCLL